MPRKKIKPRSKRKVKPVKGRTPSYYLTDEPDQLIDTGRMIYLWPNMPGG